MHSNINTKPSVVTDTARRGSVGVLRGELSFRGLLWVTVWSFNSVI